MRVRLTIGLPKSKNPKQLKFTVHLGRTGKTLPLRTYCDRLGITYTSIRESVLAMFKGVGHYEKPFDDLIRNALMRAQKRQNDRYYDCPMCRGFGWHRRSLQEKRTDCPKCEGTGNLEYQPDTIVQIADPQKRLLAQADQMQQRIEDNPEGFTK